MIISIDICLTDIPRNMIPPPYANGKRYLNLTLLDNKEGRNEYNQDGYIIIEQSKEQRLAKEQRVFVGNWKWVVRDAQQATRPPPPPARQPATYRQPAPPRPQDDDIPF